MSERGFGWRLPAVAVATVLVLLVTLARLGMHSPTAPVETVVPPTVGPTELAQVARTPVVAPSPSPTPAESPVTVYTPPGPSAQFISATGFASPISPWAGRFADGIPSAIDGEPVYRVNQALNIGIYSPTGETVAILIGGWTQWTPLHEPCGGPLYQQGCGSVTIADSPLQLGNQGVPVYGVSAVPYSGPIVIRAVADTKCVPPVGQGLMDPCLYAIRAQSIVWQGDTFTAGDPIGVMTLLRRLSEAVPNFDPQPYHDQPTCLLPRPSQAYRSDTGKVQFVFVFQSTDERFAGTTSLLLGPPYGDIGSGCDKRPPLDGKAGWISVGNVIIRVSNYATGIGTTVRSILNELTGQPSGG